MKKIISIILLLTVVSLSSADASAKITDYFDAGICAGVATAAYAQKTKTVYVNFCAIFFTVKGSIHLLKAIFID